MKASEINTDQDLLNFIEGCVNDFESSVSDRKELLNNILDLVIHIKSRATKWRKAGSMPFDEHIIIKTRTGLVRIAKRHKYPDGSSSVTYSGTIFKNITHWLPLPK